MNLPKPFGMRWFGIFVVALILGCVLELVLPYGFGMLAYMALVVGTGLLMISLSESSRRAKSWLLENW